MAHFVEKPGRDPLALGLVVDFLALNACLIKDQAKGFPMGKEITQQLGSECCVRATSDALATYYQIDTDKIDQHKKNLSVTPGLFFFTRMVMGNRLRSDSLLQARDKVIKS